MGAKDLRTGEQAEHRVREILAEYGLDYKKNPDKRAIDLVSPGLPSIEVKSKGYRQLGMRTTYEAGEYRIAHHDFQISGPIDPTIGIPTLRSGDVLRSCRAHRVQPLCQLPSTRRGGTFSADQLQRGPQTRPVAGGCHAEAIHASLARQENRLRIRR